MIACYSSHQKVTHTHHPFSSPVNYTDSFAPSPTKCLPSCLVSQGLFHLNLLHYKNLSTIYFFQSNWCHYGASKTHRTQYMKTHTHTHTHQSRTVFSLHIQSNQFCWAHSGSVSPCDLSCYWSLLTVLCNLIFDNQKLVRGIGHMAYFSLTIPLLQR